MTYQTAKTRTKSLFLAHKREAESLKRFWATLTRDRLDLETLKTLTTV